MPARNVEVFFTGELNMIIFVVQNREDLNEQELEQEYRETLKYLHEKLNYEAPIWFANGPCYYDYVPSNPINIEAGKVCEIGNDLIAMSKSDLIIFAPSSFISKSAAVMRVVTAMYNMRYIAIRNFNDEPVK